MSAAPDLTGLFQAWRGGDAAARAALDAEVYAALKRMAGGRLAGGRGPATLNPTALVHEAVARLLDARVDACSRAHFYALAALQMRAVLVDHARRRSAGKRGGGALQVTLDEALADGAAADADALLDLHEALQALAREEPRSARVLELTYFGGVAASELAALLQVSVATVERDLAFGRAWLRRRLAR
jgi:RNA polymerase sigma factor (TIGR02999 family)